MAREPLHTPIHEPVHQKTSFDNMTDDELFAFVASMEGGNVYEIPPGLAPDGMTYQWKRISVNGQPDYSNQAMLEQRGWAIVSQQRHDGRWMPLGTQGPIIVNGLALMECSSRFVAAKEAYRDRESERPVRGVSDTLNYTKPNAAPRRDTSVKRTAYQGPVEFDVE